MSAACEHSALQEQDQTCCGAIRYLAQAEHDPALLKSMVHNRVASSYGYTLTSKLLNNVYAWLAVWHGSSRVSEQDVNIRGAWLRDHDHFGPCQGLETVQIKGVRLQKLNASATQDW